MKKILVSVLVVVVVGFGLWAFRSRPVKVDVVPVEIGTFREIVQAEGRVRAKTSETLALPASGVLGKVNLKAGDVVRKGDLITVLKWDRDVDIRAPISGVVSKVYRSSPGPVQRADPLLDIVTVDDLEVVIEMLTADAVRVRPGAPVTLDGWGGEPLTTAVSRVSRAGFSKTSALGVEEERTEVTVDLSAVDRKILARLGDRYHVSCSLVIAEIPDATIIPIGAIFRRGEGWAVFRVESGRAHETPVEIGERGLRQVRILKGLNASDRVVTFPPDTLRDGLRIRE